MTGFLNIDKTSGDTSAYVVNRIKRAARIPCGHMGTLDPLASGVLPVGLGNATRLFDYFLGKEKTYRARFRFGATTPTLDAEGEVERGGEVPSEQELRAVLPRFVGTIEQVPPRFSAKCVDGKRGYELARKGENFSLPPKRVEISALDLIAQTAPDEYEFEIVCGGGTYIRALSRDIASALGTLGYTTFLRRTKSGIFTAETAVPLDRITPETWRDYLIETDSVLPFPRLDDVDGRFFQGVRIPFPSEDGVYKIYRGGAFYGTGVIEDGVLRPDKKLC